MTVGAQIIVDMLDFKLINYNDTYIDYAVSVYAVDSDESDDYSVKIWNTVTGELHQEYHCDSTGGLIDDVDVLQDELTNYVHNILFVKREHGMIRSF